MLDITTEEVISRVNAQYIRLKRFAHTGDLLVYLVEKDQCIPTRRYSE